VGELNRDSIDKELDRLDKAKDQDRNIGKSQERQLRKPNGRRLRKEREIKS
jgi:hypothetical protein